MSSILILALVRGEFAAHMINQGYQFAIDDPAIERRNEAKKYLNEGKNFLPFSNDVKFQYDVVTCFEVIGTCIGLRAR